MDSSGLEGLDAARREMEETIHPSDLRAQLEKIREVATTSIEGGMPTVSIEGDFDKLLFWIVSEHVGERLRTELISTMPMDHLRVNAVLAHSMEQLIRDEDFERKYFRLAPLYNSFIDHMRNGYGVSPASPMMEDIAKRFTLSTRMTTQLRFCAGILRKVDAWVTGTLSTHKGRITYAESAGGLHVMLYPEIVVDGTEGELAKEVAFALEMGLKEEFGDSTKKIAYEFDRHIPALQLVVTERTG